VAVQDLPEEFKKIPEDSEMGSVLYAVPGTDVAREAVMDAQIPQTAVIGRKKASLTVEYDGKPEFEKIEGTQMQWAANTATPVIRVKNNFYAVDEAVWFVSNSAEGPWVIATSVPDEIYTIPPASPVYNVTFVRIYGVTDELVYVGYTPGYTNTYVYNTTIVYGTGYYWPGWYGRYYYPRYSTWGFHVRRPNNVYADKNGNLHRRTDQGWQQRSGDGWQSTQDRQPAGQQAGRQRSQQAAQQRSQQARSSKGGTSDLNRSANSRQRGQQKSNSYRRSSGGAARRGGGRRR
jgi:hypothetical protein